MIFDFDSTLSEIEGIDVLADNAGLAEEVSNLTRQAMDGEIELESVYNKRLSAIHPTRGEIRALKEQYKKHITEDAEQVIAALVHLGHEIYIVSGGLLDPIVEIGSVLGIDKQNIRAVEVEYDEFSGEWWRSQTDFYDRNQPFLRSGETELEKTHGKADVIRDMLAGKVGKSLLIGDGISDLAASEMVDLFMGFAGIVARDLVVATAPVVLRSKSLAPVVMVAAGIDLADRLGDTEYQHLTAKARQLVEEGALHFNDQALKEIFYTNYSKAYGISRNIFG